MVTATQFDPRSLIGRPWPLLAAAASVFGCVDSVPTDVEREDPGRGAQLTNAFLNLAFEAPVALSGAPAGLPRLYVAERFGWIHQFDNDLQVEGTFEFLDVRDRVLQDAEYGGLRSFAFHPDWGVNGEVYVHYVADHPLRSVVSRFVNEEGSADRLDPDSERVLLEVPLADTLRPGGPLRFGPDGFLYVGLGDGGVEENGQDRETLRGAILRIDVSRADGGKPYAIPADNPFGQSTAPFLPEIYAWGFRDPSGIAFEPGSGSMWVTDRGGRRVDELNVVTLGGNYGWPVVEGLSCHTPPSGCQTTGLSMPVLELGGTSTPGVIHGGFVYQGSRNPELRDRYLLVDARSGQVWAIDYDGESALAQRLVRGSPGMSAIGLDAGFEPLFANTSDGLIYRFVWTSP